MREFKTIINVLSTIFQLIDQITSLDFQLARLYTLFVVSWQKIPCFREIKLHLGYGLRCCTAVCLGRRNVLFVQCAPTVLQQPQIQCVF